MQVQTAHQREAAAAGVGHADAWLKVSEAARRVRCGAGHVYAGIRGGYLEAVHIDGRGTIRLKPEAVDKWVLGGARVSDG